MTRAPDPVSIGFPDPFRLPNGCRLGTAQEWAEQRPRLLAMLLDAQYGELPAKPAEVHLDHLHTALLPSLAGGQLISLRVRTSGPTCSSFGLQVWLPAGVGPFPVILSGDGCWTYASDRVKEQVLARGYALALFNRVELAPDVPGEAPSAGPAALATWAWGFHRAVDALLLCDWVRPDQIAIVGHSRGGKAALLAGAIDERIALTACNNTGAGGCGSYRVLGPGAESMAEILDAFPHWFSPRLRAFAGAEPTLRWDQHFLMSLLAPRALLCTQSLDDSWANPMGTEQMVMASQEIYAFLKAPENLALRWRRGAHAHSEADWRCLLDFADTRFRGLPWPDQPAHTNDKTPARRLFTWRSP